MKRRLRTTLCKWLLLLLLPAAAYASPDAAGLASASLECQAGAPICAGETASIWINLDGQAPYRFQYSDGSSTYSLQTSLNRYELKVKPSSTRSYKLIGMQDAKGNGQVCGIATVAVNHCEPPKTGKDCSQNCFDSKILTQTTSGSCTTYTLQVSNDGSCQSALSHFSISVPCGKVTEASNSRGWAMEVGSQDPTTGITGIKVDNIKGFGEDGKAGSFTVTYTICATGCGTQNADTGFLVAYKAGQCVNYDVAAPPYIPMSGSLTASQNLCFGDKTGSLMLSLKGGTAPYTYSWSNGAGTANLAQLAAGTYTLTVTDAAQKQLSLKGTITQPAALQLEAITQQANCGSSNGSIDLSVSGGTAPYTYSWSNGASSQDVDNLAAGSYEVNIRDANNCSATATYTLAASSSMQLSLNSSNSECGAPATITAAITGGTAPYTYLWSSGETTAAITPATAGTYSLTVTDASGCQASASTSTANTGTSMSIAYEYSSPSCANSTDGWIDVNVSGGTAPYTYKWNSGSSSEDLENIAAGTYSLTVTDSKGCSATANISLPQTTSVSVMATEIIQPDCLGNLGGLTVSAYNGTGPYTYTWAHGASGSSLENLEPGYYTVTVTDEAGCSSSRSFQIKEPSAPSAEIQGGSCGVNTLTAQVSGGEGPYSYQWSNGETGSSITAESGQYYTVIITDQNGCTAEADIQTGEIGSPISLSTTTTSPTCYGGTNGSVDLSISGGTGSYTIVWSNGSGSEDLAGLSPGTYSVVVTDESGCIKTASVTIASPAAITVTASELISANCFGPGGITVEAQNGTAPYTYTWAHGASGSSLDNLAAGQYSVQVTDAKGCQTQASFTIKEEQAPAASIAVSGSCSSQTLSATASSGSAPYTYLWSTGSTSSSITPEVSGSYSLTVTDANGCQATAYTEISLGESTLSLKADVKGISCAGNADGSASIVASGGTAPYSYDWSNGLSTAAASNLAPGVYSVKVSDALGCYDVVAFEIKQADPLSIQLLSSSDASCGQPNGSIAVAAQGGTTPYTFKWSNGATTSSITGLAAGTYTLALIDAIGCSTEASFTLAGTAGTAAAAAWIENCEDNMIVSGSSASISVYFEGQAPYNFTYTDGQKEYTVSTEANPYSLTVSPVQTTTYTLIRSWNSCSEGSVQGTATIQVVSPKTPVCTDGCFSTSLISAIETSTCTTYTLQVNAGSDCRYDLSHFEVAVPCGSVSSMSNSKGWPMSVGLDPTTGVWGIKVDNTRLGSNESFSISYTLCNTESCAASLSSCGPLVSYKAGQCVYFGKATPASTTVANQTSTAVAGAVPSIRLYPNPLTAGQVLSLEVENLLSSSTAIISISSLTGLKVYEQQIAVSPMSNKVQLILPELPAGTYAVSLMLSNSRYTKQLFIY